MRVLGLSGVFEVAEKYEAPQNLRRWGLEIHKAQIELRKMDWGNGIQGILVIMGS